MADMWRVEEKEEGLSGHESESLETEIVMGEEEPEAVVEEEDVIPLPNQYFEFTDAELDETPRNNPKNFDIVVTATMDHGAIMTRLVKMIRPGHRVFVMQRHPVFDGTFDYIGEGEDGYQVYQHRADTA